MSELSRVQPSRNKPIIGLVGGIGAGKSSVARILESLGAAVVDSDRLSHEQFRDPEVVAQLRRGWGDGVCTARNEVDRRAVAAIVFADRDELDRLERLLYPRLARRREQLVTAYDRDPGIRAVVFDSPKLFEVGLNEQCDAVIFVEADRSVRLRRLAALRGWTDAELAKREKLLKPLDKKKAIADHVVVNHAAITELRSQVERVFSSVLTMFS